MKHLDMHMFFPSNVHNKNRDDNFSLKKVLKKNLLNILPCSGYLRSFAASTAEWKAVWKLEKRVMSTPINCWTLDKREANTELVIKWQQLMFIPLKCQELIRSLAWWHLVVETDYRLHCGEIVIPKNHCRGQLLVVCLVIFHKLLRHFIRLHKDVTPSNC